MSIKQPSSPSLEVPSEVVRAPGSFRVSWAWLFPFLAIGATAWLFFNNWSSRGPEIEVSFREAPGIEPGKTHLIYRGVQAGEVKDVRLDETLGKVIVKIQLKAFASDLAKEGTDFWIEQPVVSIRGISGLESLIQGNSIQARSGGETDRNQFEFRALDEAPLTPLDGPSLVIELKAETVPFISRGSPVFHRGTRVGWVRDKQLAEDGFPLVQVIIEEKYASTVKENTRFWILQAASVSVSPGQVHLNLPSISSLLDGGLAYDHFENAGASASSGQRFELSNNEIDARANGPRLIVEFQDAISMRVGETRVCYLGQPVGLVESIHARPGSGKVEATLRMISAMTPFINSLSQFRMVRPGVSWKGITGIETIVTGPYIAFFPVSGGEPATRFTAVTADQQREELLGSENGGLHIRLRGKELAMISSGAPVFFSGVPVGAVLAKEAKADGGAELLVGIRPGCESQVRKSSRFWRVPAMDVSAGPGLLEIKIEGLASLIQGGIAFDSFDVLGEEAAEGEVFELYPSRQLAAAVSPPVKIAFLQGQGLLEGKTQMRYLGVPVGVVDRVRVLPSKVEVEARFYKNFDFLRRTGSRFTVVRPKISLQGASGLESLVSGVYIACIPGGGNGFASEFVGLESADPNLLVQPGLEIRIIANETKISPGASVIYNGIVVGEVTDKKLSKDAKEIVLTAKIRNEYRQLVRANSQFWDSTGVVAKIGIFKVQVQAPTLVGPEGKVSFFTPEPEGAAAKSGTSFTLQEKPPKDLRK